MITTYGMMSSHTNMDPELRGTNYRLGYELVFRHVSPDKKITIKSIELVSPDSKEIEVLVDEPYYVGARWDNLYTPSVGWVVEFGLRGKDSKRRVCLNWESDRIRVEWEVS